MNQLITTRSILTALIVAFSLVSYCQGDEQLQQRLRGKTNLKEIMAIVDEYYNFGKSTEEVKKEGKQRQFEKEYIHWKRWEYYQASRLDENGRIIADLQNKIYQNFKDYKDNNPIAKTNSSYSSWVNFGPTSMTRYGSGYNSGLGRVNCIAFHPTDPDVLFIGTPQGGIWKTTNHGASWFSLTDDLPVNGISGLVVDRTNANTIYALTGDGDGSGGFVFGYGYAQTSLGVFKSTDGGSTWAATGSFPGTTGSFYGYKLIQHPTSASTLFAVTTQGIFRTTNSASSWTQVQTGNFTDIEFKPGTPSTMYAAQKGGSNPFWRSTNSGVDWDNSGTTGDPTSTGRIAIGVSVANADYVYILAGPATGSGSFTGVYRSTNSGVSFTSRSTTPNILGYPNNGSDNQDQDTYDLCIEVDPNDINDICTGGINIWRSTDGGSSWGGSARTQWYDDVLTIDYVHADVHNLTFSPYNGRLYTCTDGGVGYSTNDGANWTAISNSLHILATYHADFYEANEDIMVSGTQDNGTDVRYTASNTYRHIYGADGFDNVIKDNDPDTIVYVANGTILRTTQGGLNDVNVSPAGVSTFPCIARDYNNNRVIFAGDGGDIWKSTTFGSSSGTWGVSAAGTASRVLTTCTSNSDRLYAGDGTTLLRSDNATNAAGSITYTTISGRPGYPTGVNNTDVEVRPANSLDVYASFGGYVAGRKVYFSTDGGDNWTNVSGSLPNVACHSVTVDKNNTVYVGTDIGVFVRATSMSDWQPFYNLLPKAPVSELMVNNTTNRIIACTFGRGNFYTDFYSTCPTNLGISGTITGSRFYNASDYITSSAIIGNGAGNKAAFIAGNYVRLDPGFEVKNGSEFIADISPCGTGGIPIRVASLNDRIATETMYVDAVNGMRYPYAKITSILPNKDGANIEVITPARYSLRITSKDGRVIEVVEKDKTMAAGDFVINWNRANYSPGFYYAQLFMDGQLVHFQEVDVR